MTLPKYVPVKKGMPGAFTCLGNWYSLADPASMNSLKETLRRVCPTDLKTAKQEIAEARRHYRPKELICACCGKHTKGRQWYNRDTGYGLCPNCYTWLKERKSDYEIQVSYGHHGIHFCIEDKTMNRAEQQVAELNHGQVSWTDLLTEANEIGEAYDQDWDAECTWFEFADRSVALFNGVEQTITAYGSKG